MKRRPLIRKYGSFLDGLSRLPPKCRTKLINDSPKEVIDCVGECCLNLIKGKVPVSSAQKKTLNAKKHHIRLLSSKRVPVGYKKKLLTQKGGALLGLLLKPLLGSVLGTLLHGGS